MKIADNGKSLRKVNEAFDYNQAVDYIESRGIGCDPCQDIEGEYVCDLLDELGGGLGSEDYSKEELNRIVSSALEFKKDAEAWDDDFETSDTYDLEESRKGISIASAVKEAMELDEGKEPPIRKVLEANDIMATLDRDPQGTIEKAIQLVKESDEISEKDKYTFAQAVGTGPISKRVSSLASYFYDVPRVGKRR